jgi:hypothetical protein
MKQLPFDPVQLGDRVKDPVSGVVGIATSITIWLHGCIRVGVQSEKPTNEGRSAEIQYFDQSQLVIVKKGIYKAMTLGLVPAAAPAPHRGSGGPARESAGFRA